MKIKKDYILAAGFFAASFVVINVGMFFFLKMTQPKMGARRTEVVAKHNGADSLHAPITGKMDTLQHNNLAHVAVTETAPDSQKATPPTADTQVNPAMAAPAARVDDHLQEPSPVNETDLAAKEEAAHDENAVDSLVPPSNNNSEVLATDETPPNEIREMAKLAKLLDTMKPDEAASIASRLETDQIIALMMRMKDRNGGKMLAAMPVEISSKIAAQMSQMATRARVKS